MEQEKVFTMLHGSLWYLPSGLGEDKAAVSSMLIEAAFVGWWTAASDI